MRLPLTGRDQPPRGGALALRGCMLPALDVPLHVDSAAWLRLSAQAYNEMADYARLVDILARVLPAA